MTSKIGYKGRNAESKASKGCFQCGHLDHWAKDCPKNASSEKTAVTSGRKGQSSSSSNWKSQSSNPSGKAPLTEKPKEKPKGKAKGKDNGGKSKGDKGKSKGGKGGEWKSNQQQGQGADWYG